MIDLNGYSFTVEDREILRFLFESSDKVNIYFFHDKYLLSPGQLSRSFRKMIDLKIVELVDLNAQLTEYGRKWVIANRVKIFYNVGKQYWKDLPDEILKPQLEINKPYLPIKKKIDYEFFKKYFETP